MIYTYYNTKPQNVKFIISSSINNISNKLALLKNLCNINLDLTPNDLSKLIYSQNLDNINLYNNENLISNLKEYKEFEDELQNRPECDFCEKIFIEEKKRRAEKIKEKIEYNNYSINDSKCFLDNIFINNTIKNYYSSLANGQEISKSILSAQEYNMAENFHFNLKYIIKYLNFKSQQKKLNESDEKFEERIIGKFYFKLF